MDDDKKRELGNLIADNLHLLKIGNKYLTSKGYLDSIEIVDLITELTINVGE